MLKRRENIQSLRHSCFLIGLLLAISPPVFADTLTVAVAANVQYAFDALRAEFKKETGHDIKPTYNSSGKFTAQIMHGAPFDVFLSADMEFPEKLYKEGFTTGAPKPYAYGSLVLWTMKNIDLSNWQSTLSGSAVDTIAIANPVTAPYGRETMKALAYYKLDRTLKSKLVFGESIAQTNQYIYSKVADAGFTAKSVVVAQQMKGQGKWIDVPKEAYQPIAQGAVILKQGQTSNPKAAQSFYSFLYGAKARAIFDRYGYILP
jgi:molybdate transport system substrate-binding protein